MANPKTPGDLFFESYCDLNGYLHWHDPVNDAQLEIDGPTEPDYLIERAGFRALVEVKHFTTTRETERLMASPTLTASFGGRELYGTLQSAIRVGGEQLAPFAALGVPLVVAATNPLRADVSFDFEDVCSALLGQVQWRINLEEPGDAYPVYTGKDAAVLHQEPNGEQANRLPHVSAVIAMYAIESFPCVDVYELSGTPKFTGTPLSRMMFDADEDVWFGFVETHRFARLPKL